MCTVLKKHNVVRASYEFNTSVPMCQGFKSGIHTEAMKLKKRDLVFYKKNQEGFLVCKDRDMSQEHDKRNAG